MYEPVLQLLTSAVVTYQDDTEPPHRTGSRVPNGVPRNVYRTADGAWLVVSGTTDNQVGRLLPLLGLDTPAGRERFGRAAQRTQHADELDGLVADWIAARERDDVIETLLAARIPVAPVNTLADLVADPHTAARGNFVTVDDPAFGSIRMVAPTPRLSATPGEVRWTGPDLGAHNEEVYRDWLGLDADEVAKLRADGVI
jgi:crotonobetainyl-CoA:carnitine CoA-transferase CaiB-like acyl-CoA transferase